MVLATHLVIGGVLSKAVGEPWLAFGLGFVSHFLLDLIPHWDYPLRSKKDDPDDKLNVAMPLGPDFAIDLLKIGLDLAIGGIVLGVVVKWQHWSINPALLAGAIGAILPDFLQFAYFKLRWAPLRQLQRFHQWIHTGYRLKSWHIAGPLLQVLLIALVLVILNL